jgi:hypothetical protein
VLGPDEAVVEPARFLLGQYQGPAGTVGKSLKHPNRISPGERVRHGSDVESVTDARQRRAGRMTSGVAGMGVHVDEPKSPLSDVFSVGEIGHYWSMPMSATKLVDCAINVRLKALAKEADFRRKGHTWTRSPRPETVQVASVKGSQSNTTGVAKFTLSLGLHFSVLDEMLDEPAVESPKEYDCQVRCRIGRLAGMGDHWWTVSTDVESSEAGEDMARKWESLGIPWLESVSDPIGALDWLEAGDFAFHSAIDGASLALASGQPERARRIIESNRERMNPAQVAWALDKGVF